MLGIELFVDRGTVSLNLCTESLQSHLSLHAVYEGCGGGRRARARIQRPETAQHVSRVGGQRVSWCQDAAERQSNTKPLQPFSLSLPGSFIQYTSLGIGDNISLSQLTCLSQCPIVDLLMQIN